MTESAESLEIQLAEAKRQLAEMRNDRNEWMYAARAARDHYEQSDARLAEVERVCRDAETMQWADISRAYGDGVVAAVGWVRTAARKMGAALSVAPNEAS